MSRPRPADAPVVLALRRTYDAAPEEVWAAWTRADAIARWWLPSPRATTDVHEVDPREGGKLRLTMHVPEALEGAGTDRFPVEATFLVLRPPHEIVLRFGEEGVAGSHVARVTLERDGARTRMRFEVTGEPAEEALEGMEEGWGLCFDRLGALVERRDAAPAVRPMSRREIA